MLLRSLILLSLLLVCHARGAGSVVGASKVAAEWFDLQEPDTAGSGTALAGNSDYLRWQQFPTDLPAANLTGFRFYVNAWTSGTETIKLALYDSGDNLVTNATVAVSSLPAEGWAEVLIDPVPIAAGPYRVAVAWTAAAGVELRVNNTGTHFLESSGTYNYASFPPALLDFAATSTPMGQLCLGVLLDTAPAVPGGGAFASLETTATGNNDTAETTHSVGWPTGVQEGDVVVIEMAMASGTTVSASGWNTSSGLGSLRGHILYRKIGPSENGPTSVTTGSSVRTAWVVRRWSGAHGDVEYAAAGSNDPPALTHSWGSAKTVWGAALSARRSDWSATAEPTDFTGLLQSGNPSNSATTRTKVASAVREFEGASVDPGTFTVSGTADSPGAMTYAIRPQ
jgi:hypothetical protein